MAKYRYLQRVVKDGGPEDTRIWMWTSELAKDPISGKYSPISQGKSLRRLRRINLCGRSIPGSESSILSKRFPLKQG